MKKNFEILENDKNQSEDDFYRDFQSKLEESQRFPGEYIFKYIVPTDEKTIAMIYAIFNDPKANISTRESSNGKYTSFTIKLEVQDAHDVILYYRQTSKIEGIVTL